MGKAGWLRGVASGLLFASTSLACSDEGDGSGGGGGGSDTANGASTNAATGSTNASSGSSGSTAATTATSSSGNGGGAPGVDDPNLDGPYTFDEVDASTTSPSGNMVPIHAAFPTGGPTAGPYPVIVVAHGFQLPASQYTSYVQRLASHGFVALTADYPASFIGVNNGENAQDLIAALDWAASASELGGAADASTAGMTGHSMGGKLALLAATMDDRVQAAITLDPVDGAMSCSPQDCPDVSNLMPLDIPTGFLGETLDAMGGFMACAPAADNYTTFYAGTTAPSLSVTVLGANHMSFLDDVASCGFTCSFCNAATLDNATVNALSRAFVVAFYRRYLRGETAYDAFLTGADAQARYVDTGLAAIESK